jgi:hypothetical protein
MPLDAVSAGRRAVSVHKAPRSQPRLAVMADTQISTPEVIIRRGKGVPLQV